MEATGVSIGKSVLNGALGYAKSAAVNEVALQFGVHRDKSFITDELEMMQSFLMVAHEERGEHSKVTKTWVKQVRDVAYDVEDSLQDFVVRLQKQKWSLWRVPRTFLDRRHVAKQMLDLRAKVEDVSQRNIRYGLIKGSSSTEPTAAAVAMFGVDEARHAAKQHHSRQNLAQLINKEGDNLAVIGVWGTSGSVGHTSIIWEAYGNPIVKLNFPCRAWVRIMRPFRPKEFVQSMVKQFHTAAGVVALLEGKRTGQGLAQEFNRYVNENRYLIVITGLSTIEEWNEISTCFPENKLGSRIVVSTEQAEVASLCPGQASVVSELKQLSSDQTIYAFYQQSSQGVTYSSKAESSTTFPYTTENEIQEDQSNANVDGKMVDQTRFSRTNTMVGVPEEFQLVGREKEKLDIIKLIQEQASTQQFQVIAVWGMGGLGKTTLIKDVCQRQGISDMFGKHAFVTVLRPFKLEELLKSLALQLNSRNDANDFAGDSKEKLALMGVAELTKVLARLSEGKSCLIVLDDLSSTTEWDLISPSLIEMRNARLVVVITTRREDTAKHCCKKPESILLLNGLKDKDACDLFTSKVFKDKTTDMAKQYPELVEPAKLILKKCNGLPLAIVTIGGFLADQPTKTAAEWRKLNEHISVELEMNPKFDAIKTVLMKSYDGLPYYLKSCFLYFSIFPEDCIVRRKTLVRRWIAEGYALDRFIAERYFMELVERSMIIPTQRSIYSREGNDSCQLHDLIRDISIAKSMEENLVFRLEEGCSSSTHGAVRHLSISSNWTGDEHEFESTIELSRIRSLTVFGKWRPFYISDKMRFLRVLDLEGTDGLHDHHLEHIGKLVHLRYLSLRWCEGIYYLPDSVGNLRQLETLDIKHTRILTLPRNMTKLTKLRYLKAGTTLHTKANRTAHCPKNCQDLLTLPCCMPCCAPLLGFCGPEVLTSRVPSCMRFNKPCCADRYYVKPYGVKLPTGTGKLKALHTLRYVQGAQEIKGLTSLRKLGVFGINTKNGPEFCSSICSLSRLESLSVLSHGTDLYDSLHGMYSPPETLQSLMLRGCLKKLPGWIKGLQNLVKLKLVYTEVLEDGETMQVLGILPNLSILVLREGSFQIRAPFTFQSFTFQSGLFKSLLVLELQNEFVKMISVEFEPTSMPKLEFLNLGLNHSRTCISGLEFLPSIKVVWLDVTFYSYEVKQGQNMTEEEAEKETKHREEKIKEDIGKQLATNKNGPILKVR